jgi:hypothetical protein
MLRKGKAELTALTQLGPPATPGKSFCSGAPWRYALTSSVGVWHPGTETMLRAAHHSMTKGTENWEQINMN